MDQVHQIIGCVGRGFGPAAGLPPGVRSLRQLAETPAAKPAPSTAFHPTPASGIRLRNDSAADTKTHQPVQKHRGPNHNTQFRRAIKPQIPHSPRINPASTRFEIVEQFHAAPFRRTGHRAAGKQRPHAIDSGAPPAAAAPRNRAHKLMNSRVRFDFHQPRSTCTLPTSHTRDRSCRTKSTIIRFSPPGSAHRSQAGHAAACVLFPRHSPAASFPR